MEFRHIRSFLSVARTLNFSKSAGEIHLSQPALTLQIQALEEAIGVRPLERNRRKTTLTAAGLVFRDEVEAVLVQLEQAVRKARLAAKGKLGLLRVGFVSTAGYEIVPMIVRSFRQAYPEAEFSLRNILTTDQLPMLRSGELDIGFLRLPIDSYPELDVTTVHREPLVIALSSSHRLAGRQSLRLSELTGEHFLMYERAYAPGFHDLLMGILGLAGVVPRIAQTAGQMPTLVSLVDAGMGVALLPASVIRHNSSSVIGAQIEDDAPLTEIAMVTLRSTRSITKLFREFAIIARADRFSNKTGESSAGAREVR